MVLPVLLGPTFSIFVFNNIFHKKQNMFITFKTHEFRCFLFPRIMQIRELLGIRAAQPISVDSGPSLAESGKWLVEFGLDLANPGPSSPNIGRNQSTFGDFGGNWVEVAPDLSTTWPELY